MPRPLRSKSSGALTVAFGLGLFLATSAASALPGDLATKFTVDDEDPLASIPTLEQRNTDPLEFGNFLQDLIARAEGAFREKDFAGAAKYYEALARAVPERAVSFSRLCQSYAGLGKLELAIANCARTVRLDGARVFDHFRFVNLTLQKKQLSPQDLAEVEASLSHLRSHAATAPAAREPERSLAPPAPEPADADATPEQRKERLKQEFLKKREARLLAEVGERDSQEASPAARLPTEIELLSCKLAVRIRDADRLKQCTAALQKLELDEKLVLPFAWSEALIRKDSARANTLLETARKAGIPDSALAAMAEEQARALGGTGVWGSFERWGLMGLIGIAALALAALGVTRTRRDRRKVQGELSRASS